MLFKRLLGRKIGTAAPASQQDRLAAALASPDNGVRREACRRLADLGALRRLAAEDSDAGVRDVAGARYRRLLCGLDDHAPPLPARLAELDGTVDQALLAQVAGQGQEPELRLAAIGQLTEPEMLAACAIDDPLAGNRLAAAERVQDKAALERIVKGIGKRDKRVYRLARERLRATVEAEERPRVAREQGEALCRKLERLGRFDNWEQDRAVLDHIDSQWATIHDDTDAELRERYATRRRGFLDAYQAHAREHAAQYAEQQAREEAARAREGLIAELDKAHELDDLADLQRRLDEVAQGWASLGEADARIAKRLQQDYDAALSKAHAHRAQLTERRREAQAAMRLLADVRRLQDRGSVPERKTLRALQQRFDALAAADGPEREAIGAGLEQLTRRFDRHRHQLERKLAALPDRLRELDSHFEQGELKRVEPLYQSITATLEHARAAGLPQADLAPIDAHLKGIAPRLHELRQWRRWSADEHRNGLCDAIEALADDSERPPELAVNRLHDLQREWRELDRNGAPAAEHLWHRFQAAAKRVHDRCKPYMDQQAVIRAENRKQREALCAQLEAFLKQVDWERIDWKKLARAEREMRQAWAALGPVDARHYKPLEGRFRRDLRRLDKALSDERERNQAEKRRLIAEMEALAAEPDLRRAIDSAKALQQQWHTTVAGRQRDENALWKTFRAASDAVFARRQAEQEARGAELRENQAAREAICQELAALTAATDIDLSSFEQSLRAVETRWQDTESLPVPRSAATGLARQWQGLLREADARLGALREADRWAANARLATRAAWLNDIASQVVDAPQAADSVALQSQWSSMPPIDDAHSKATLEQTFGDIIAAIGDPAVRDALARRLEQNRVRREKLCLHLEIVAGVASPPALREQRMALQVERLRERMGEGEADPLANAGPLLQDWWLSTPAASTPALDARFDRVKQALAAGDLAPAPA
jgi:flagellar biosynthesis regulator FlaF